MRKNKDINIAEIFGASEARDQRFSVYIPNKDKSDVPVAPGAQERWIDEAVKLLAEICGGATAMPPIRGAWLNKENGILVKEEPVMVYTFIDSDEFAKRIADVVSMVQRIGREANQGQMAFEFNQAFYLIDIK